MQVFLVANQQIEQQFRLGDNFEFQQRIILHRLLLVPLAFNAQRHYSLYVRVASTSGLQVPLTLWEVHEFQGYDQTRQFELGIFYGSLLIMMAYNFFIWLSVRERSYLFYVIFVMSFGLLLASIDGFTFQYLWPTQVWWNNRAIVIILALTLFLSMAFSKNFLHTARYNPRLNKVLTVYMSLMAVVVAAGFYFPYRYMIVIT